MATVLVTGGSGLVGKALQRLQKAYKCYKFLFPTRAELDCTDLASIHTYFQLHRPTYVIHLAANVGGLFKNLTQKVGMLEDNIAINSNVLRCCHEYKVVKVVSCLSTCIFPNATTYPIDETMLHAGPPHPSNEGYAYAKRLLEVQSRAYRRQYGDNFVCVIPTNLYGPYDNFHLEDAHVIPALIHRCYLCREMKKPFAVKGTGAPLRQFLHCDDFALLLMWTLENYNEETPLIIAPEKEYSIGEVATSIARFLNYKEQVEFTGKSEEDGQYKKTASNEKLRELYPQLTFRELENGLRETVSWFLENYSALRK